MILNRWIYRQSFLRFWKFLCFCWKFWQKIWFLWRHFKSVVNFMIWKILCIFESVLVNIMYIEISKYFRRFFFLNLDQCHFCLIKIIGNSSDTSAKIGYVNQMQNYSLTLNLFFIFCWKIRSKLKNREFLCGWQLTRYYTSNLKVARCKSDYLISF